MAPHRPLRLKSAPFYGILVTEKSSLLGLRRFVKAHHATFLAHRVLGSHLPAELVDHIAEDITALEYAGMLQLWKALTHKKDHRSAIFGPPEVSGSGTVAEQAAIEELALMIDGRTSLTIVVDRTDADRTERYTHFSASKTWPDLVELVPGISSASGPTLLYAGGRLQVKCSPGTLSANAMEQVTVWPSSPALKVGRLVQIDGVEEVIRGWDQEAAERYVKVLGLKVVSMKGAEAGDLTPCLRLLQTAEWL
jgi:hypothetical protein